MELGGEGRRGHGKFIQRFAYRSALETQGRQMPNSFRHFAQPAIRIDSRAATESLPHDQHEAPREVDSHFGEANR